HREIRCATGVLEQRPVASHTLYDTLLCATAVFTGDAQGQIQQNCRRMLIRIPQVEPIESVDRILLLRYRLGQRVGSLFRESVGREPPCARIGCRICMDRHEEVGLVVVSNLYPLRQRKEAVAVSCQDDRVFTASQVVANGKASGKRDVLFPSATAPNRAWITATMTRINDDHRSPGLERRQWRHGGQPPGPRRG